MELSLNLIMDELDMEADIIYRRIRIPDFHLWNCFHRLLLIFHRISCLSAVCLKLWLYRQAKVCISFVCGIVW